MTASVLEAVSGPAFQSVRKRLDSLGAAPPQVLLLEGGSEASRMDAALYWACRCSCPAAAETGSPCLTCPTCSQIAAHEYLDLICLDGRISNKQDQEEPGPVRALNMDNVRALKSVIAGAPHSGPCRIVVLAGLDSTRTEAANALLKALEEPSPSTIFVLLTPQREQILPTLVSRSFCFTLPWPDPEAADAAMSALQDDIALFLQTGQKLFSVTGQRSFSQAQAQDMLTAVQKSLLRVMAGSPHAGHLDDELSSLPPASRVLACRFLKDAADLLAAQVTPSRAVEAFMANLFALRHGL